MSNAEASESTPYYFISYSRQELTFADSFSRELERNGLRNWVDFRKLVPGKPWQPQLDQGVANAAAILLVVSQASMTSRAVQDEWTKSIAAGKRIILIIFEPCKLHPDLVGLEWVDFTGNFDAALQQTRVLLNRLAQKVTSTPPQEGIRLPDNARIFYALSIVAAILSILGGLLALSLPLVLLIQEIFFNISYTVSNAMTQAAPYATNELRSLITSGIGMSVLLLWSPAIWNFVRIPGRLRKRTHDAEQLAGALNSLIIANIFMLIVPISMFTTDIWDNFDMVGVLQSVLCLSMPLMLTILVVWVLLYFTLRSDSMYRWAGPTGAIIRVSRPVLRDHPNKIVPLKVTVESAPQDLRYARELKTSITKAGHIITENADEAEIVLPLLSAYKNNSKHDPEHKRMLPLLMQNCEVHPSLSKVQWIDLRHGKRSMDAVANRLDEQNDLLQKLGVLPLRTVILPASVKRLRGLLSTVLAMSVIFVFFSISQGQPVALLFSILIGLGTYFLRSYIVERRSNRLSFLSYGWVWMIAVALAVLAIFAKWDPAVLMVPIVWLVPLLMLSKEIRMWLPAKA